MLKDFEDYYSNDDEVIDIIDSIDWLKHMIRMFVDYDGSEFEGRQIIKQANEIADMIEDASIEENLKIQLNEEVERIISSDF